MAIWGFDGGLEGGDFRWAGLWDLLLLYFDTYQLSKQISGLMWVYIGW